MLASAIKQRELRKAKVASNMLTSRDEKLLVFVFHKMFHKMFQNLFPVFQYFFSSFNNFFVLLINTSSHLQMETAIFKIFQFCFAVHRKKSYPHMYPPLKSLHFRSSRRISSPRQSESESADGGSDVRKFFFLRPINL